MYNSSDCKWGIEIPNQIQTYKINWSGSAECRSVPHDRGPWCYNGSTVWHTETFTPRIRNRVRVSVHSPPKCKSETSVLIVPRNLRFLSTNGTRVPTVRAPHPYSSTVASVGRPPSRTAHSNIWGKKRKWWKKQSKQFSKNTASEKKVGKSDQYKFWKISAWVPLFSMFPGCNAFYLWSLSDSSKTIDIDHFVFGPLSNVPQSANTGNKWTQWIDRR